MEFTTRFASPRVRQRRGRLSPPSVVSAGSRLEATGVSTPPGIPPPPPGTTSPIPFFPPIVPVENTFPTRYLVACRLPRYRARIATGRVKGEGRHANEQEGREPIGSCRPSTEGGGTVAGKTRRRDRRPAGRGRATAPRAAGAPDRAGDAERRVAPCAAGARSVPGQVLRPVRPCAGGVFHRQRAGVDPRGESPGGRSAGRGKKPAGRSSP